MTLSILSGSGNANGEMYTLHCTFGLRILMVFNTYKMAKKQRRNWQAVLDYSVGCARLLRDIIIQWVDESKKEISSRLDEILCTAYRRWQKHRFHFFIRIALNGPQRVGSTLHLKIFCRRDEYPLEAGMQKFLAMRTHKNAKAKFYR